MFNHIWQRGDFPKNWKTATVLPLLKSVQNPSLVESYRPISLTSTLGKLYEKLVARRLLWELESKKLFRPEQYSFCPGQATTDKIMHIQALIHQGFSQKQHILAVFLDISKSL